MRLHFSIGCYDYHRAARLRRSFQFKRIQFKSFSLIMCIDAQESTTIFDFMAQASTNFPKVRKMLLYFLFLILGIPSLSPFLQILESSFPDRSWFLSVTDFRSCQSPFFNKATALLSLFDLHHFVGCVSTWRCANEHFSPKRQPFLFFVEQAFWRMPSFTEWVIATSSKVILARPSRHSTTRTLTSGTSGPRWFSLTLLHKRIPMDLAYMCVKPQMRLYVCQALPPSQTPNAFICVSPNAFICVSPNAFICVSPNAFICVSPNASAESATELASLAYLCSLRSHVF